MNKKGPDVRLPYPHLSNPFNRTKICRMCGRISATTEALTKHINEIHLVKSPEQLAKQRANQLKKGIDN